MTESRPPERAPEWERPILIGSCGSSGSTLLSVMLHAHPDVLCGPELALFAHPFFWGLEGPKWRERVLHYLGLGPNARLLPEWTLGNGLCPYAGLVFENTLPWYGLTMPDLKAVVEKSSGPRELVRTVFGPLLQAHGRRIWAEKSPQNVYAFRAFLDCYPQGKVVCLVRDVRDVVCSLMRKKWGGFKQALSFWLVDTAICDSFRDHPRVFFVRYEDLVGQPRRLITELLDFLNLAPEIDRVLDYVRTSSRVSAMDASSAGDPAWLNSPGRPISTQAVGVWRDMLTPEHLAAVSAACMIHPVEDYPHIEGQTVSRLLARYGYEPVEAKGVNGSRLLRLINDEKLFLSGDQYAEGGLFHERFVECDPARLPESGFSWEEKKIRAKFSNVRHEMEKLWTVHAELQSRHQALHADHQALLSVPGIHFLRRFHELPYGVLPGALLRRFRRLLWGG